MLTVVGLVVVGIGIILIPLPGPGWAIVFGGLGILSSQWPWLRRPIAALRGVAAETPPFLLGLAVIGGGFLLLNAPFELPNAHIAARTTIVFGALILPFQIPALRLYANRVLRRDPSWVQTSDEGGDGGDTGR